VEDDDYLLFCVIFAPQESALAWQYSVEPPVAVYGSPQSTVWRALSFGCPIFARIPNSSPCAVLNHSCCRVATLQR